MFEKSRLPSDLKALRKKILNAFILIAGLLIISTYVYSKLEGWSIVDGLYFSTITLTTIGYGDIHPTTDISKIFTILFIFVGVALMANILTLLGNYYFHYLEHKQTQFQDTFNKFTTPKEEKWIDIKIKEKIQTLPEGVNIKENKNKFEKY